MPVVRHADVMTRALREVRALVPSDPGFAALRRAARFTLLMPASLAASIAFQADPQFSLFLAFGFFALLVMADLGGLRRPRAAAHVATAAVGGVFVVAGTLASATALSAAVVTLVVCVVVRFGVVFGGYAAAAQPALLLSFVLGVAYPGPPASIPTRLAGWLVAGALSTLAATLIWPRFEKVGLLQEAAAARRSLAQLVTVGRRSGKLSDIGDAVRAATAAVNAARHNYATTPTRPAGPARRDGALVELLTQLGSMLDFATRPFNQEASTRALSVTGNRPSIDEGNRLAAPWLRRCAPLRTCSPAAAGRPISSGSSTPNTLIVARWTAGQVTRCDQARRQSKCSRAWTGTAR
jgi:hypothetical protein